jgi:redox-regulated HSP33 family molecular chaperone
MPASTRTASIPPPPLSARSARAISPILIDQGEGMVPYQGITPIAGGSLSACAETYFAQSEQLPTRFAVTFGRASTPAPPRIGAQAA